MDLLAGVLVTLLAAASVWFAFTEKFDWHSDYNALWARMGFAGAVMLAIQVTHAAAVSLLFSVLGLAAAVLLVHGGWVWYKH